MELFPPEFCVMPFVGLHVSTGGTLAPCCEYDGSWGELDQNDFNTAQNSAEAVSDRAAFLSSQGTPVATCWRCFDSEANGKVSLRQRSNETLAALLAHTAAHDGNPTGEHCAPYVQVRFSNLCNFECRLCWHGSSSSWFKDAERLGLTSGPRAQISSITSIDQLLELMNGDLSDIRHLYFAGGAPLMIVENYQLLERLLAEGRSDVELSFTTNGSHLGLGQRCMLELWKQFKVVTVELSVDATRQEAAALIRSGFYFDVFKETVGAIRAECPQAKIMFGITVSALNLAELPQTLRDLRGACGAGAADFSIHRVQAPTHLRPSVLPRRAKAYAVKTLEAFIEEVSRDWGDDATVRDLVAQLRGIAQAVRAPSQSDDLIALADSQPALDGLLGEDIRHALPDLFGAGGYPMPSLWSRGRKELSGMIARSKRVFQ